jgi:hypothetical protein
MTVAGAHFLEGQWKQRGRRRILTAPGFAREQG